jgi:beta-lactam-binding protein with PASTA domain
MRPRLRTGLAVATGTVIALAAAAPAVAAPSPASDPVVILTVVPDLTGETASQARLSLTTVGLALGSAASTIDCEHLNRVAAQSPAPGATVPFGSTVSVSLGVAPRPPAACR